MKKLLSLVLVALMVLPFGALATVGVSAAEEVIYVKDGATGDGSSADNAFGLFTDAVNAATAKTADVTIKIVGTVNVDTTADNGGFTTLAFTENAHTNKITWAGNDDSSKLIIKTKASGNASYFHMAGALCIKDIDIEISGGKVLCLVTHFNDLTIDTGVTVKNTTDGKATEILSIYGEISGTYASNPCYNADTKTHTANPNYTIKSGSFKEFVPYITGLTTKHKGVNLNGKITVYISGDTTISKVLVASNSYNTAKDCDITLDGGKITTLLAAADRAYKKDDGNGMVTYGYAGITGTFNLYLTKNFDIAAQGVSGAVGSEFHNKLCGSTANKFYAGSLEDTNLGTYVLKADAEIFDAINAEETKINKETFDSVVKVEAPAGTTTPGGSTTTPTTPPAQNNPNTGDSFVIIAVVATIAAAALVVVSKKKVTR